MFTKTDGCFILSPRTLFNWRSTLVRLKDNHFGMQLLYRHNLKLYLYVGFGKCCRLVVRIWGEAENEYYKSTVRVVWLVIYIGFESFPFKDTVNRLYFSLILSIIECLILGNAMMLLKMCLKETNLRVEMFRYCLSMIVSSGSKYNFL